MIDDQARHDGALGVGDLKHAADLADLHIETPEQAQRALIAGAKRQMDDQAARAREFEVAMGVPGMRRFARHI